MKIKRSHIISTVILLAVILWIKVFWLTEVFHTHKANDPNRNALLQIRDAISLGNSYADVLKAFWEYRTDELRIQVNDPSSWTVGMPLEFGASDWVLLIEFQDGSVTAVRVHTSDGPPPKDAPKDKTKNSAG